MPVAAVAAEIFVDADRETRMIPCFPIRVSANQNSRCLSLFGNILQRRLGDEPRAGLAML